MVLLSIPAGLDSFQATMVPLGLTAGGKTPQTSQAAQAVQQAQQQLLGGLGISSVIQQQVVSLILFPPGFVLCFSL